VTPSTSFEKVDLNARAQTNTNHKMSHMSAASRVSNRAASSTSNDYSKV